MTLAAAPLAKTRRLVLLRRILSLAWVEFVLIR